jgi:hypothetical protein
MFTLRAGNEHETVGLEHTIGGRIGGRQVLVHRPELPGVEMFGQRERVEADATGHANHPDDRGAVEGEVLGHVRVRVRVNSLQS